MKTELLATEDTESTEKGIGMAGVDFAIRLELSFCSVNSVSSVAKQVFA
jgi:hypothetical protein